MLSVRNVGRIYYRNDSLVIRPGDMVIYRALPLHEFSGDKDWSYYWFHLPTSLFREYNELPCNTNVPGV